MPNQETQAKYRQAQKTLSQINKLKEKIEVEIYRIEAENSVINIEVLAELEEIIRKLSYKIV